MRDKQNKEKKLLRNAGNVLHADERWIYDET